MTKTPRGMEEISIRRAVIADTDKVRYRVYSTPTDFVAVIAESALMAVKVAGVSKPHKIVRDMPTNGVSIEAKKMAVVTENAERQTLAVKPHERPKHMNVSVSEYVKPTSRELFSPMSLGQLRKSDQRARILPPEMVNEIIEQHAKAPPPPPIVEAAEPAPLPPHTAQPTQEEKLLAMAQDLPSGNEVALIDDSPLTSEEIEKLLNG